MGNTTKWSTKEWLIAITLFLVAVLLTWLSWALLAGDFGEDVAWVGYFPLPILAVVILLIIASYRKGNRVSPPKRNEPDEIEP